MSNQNNENEFDFSQVGQKINGLISSVNLKLFELVLFLKKNSITLVVIVISGFALGYFLDKKLKTYKNQVILTTNFGSYDMLKNKINLINAKIADADTVFIKSIGISNPEHIGLLKLEPFVDIFQFVEKESNYELVKLMAEDMSMDKIINDENTIKNFPNHMLSFKCAEIISEEEVINPLMSFLNSNSFYVEVQKEYLNNIDNKIRENDSIIKQIDDILVQFKNSPAQSKSQALVFYNENTQLNDLINTKNGMISEIGRLKIEKIGSKKIFNETSVNLNALNNKGINGKNKFIFPFVFLVIFLIFQLVRKWYFSTAQNYKTAL